MGTIDQFERQQSKNGLGQVMTGAGTSVHEHGEYARVKSSTFQLGGAADAPEPSAKKTKFRANSNAKHSIDALRKRNEKFTDQDVDEWMQGY